MGKRVSVSMVSKDVLGCLILDAPAAHRYSRSFLARYDMHGRDLTDLLVRSSLGMTCTAGFDGLAQPFLVLYEIHGKVLTVPWSLQAFGAMSDRILLSMSYRGAAECIYGQKGECIYGFKSCPWMFDP